MLSGSTLLEGSAGGLDELFSEVTVARLDDCPEDSFFDGHGILIFSAPGLHSLVLVDSEHHVTLCLEEGLSLSSRSNVWLEVRS